MMDGRTQLFHGDSRDVLRTLPDASVDSIVTDPPYALVSIVKRFGAEGAAPSKGNDAYARASAGFMGKNWDTGETAFAVEFWTQCLRVLKPGGHVLAFSGTRTYHRLAVAIEDAGFEIRDMVSWNYGAGFPKSLDVSKAIDKAAGVSFSAKPASGVGFMGADGPGGYNVTKNQLTREGESTPEAKQWLGWGTALKPACEPIVLARKPLCGTVANNVLTHGTGALNIDGCRVEGDFNDSEAYAYTGNNGVAMGAASERLRKSGGGAGSPFGRWPANLLHDGSDEVREAFGGAHRFFYSAKASKADRNEGCEDMEPRNNMRVNGPRESEEAKHATTRSNHHPTVKPVDLMRYLCRLITPPNGVVLDPFMGSGSTGKAALAEGFRFIGIEREQEYFEIAQKRVAEPRELAERKIVREAVSVGQGFLFGGE